MKTGVHVNEQDPSNDTGIETDGSLGRTLTQVGRVSATISQSHKDHRVDHSQEALHTDAALEQGPSDHDQANISKTFDEEDVGDQ